MAERTTPDDDGLTLRELMDAAKAEGRLLPVGLVLRMAQATAKRLSERHAARLPDGTPQPEVHGDLRPRDIVIQPSGEVSIDAPVGVTRPAESNHALYVPPERLDGHAPDIAADQYAWGLIVWEMLAGCPLFAGESAEDTVSSLRTGHVVAPSTLREDLPDGLNTLVMRTLATRARNRFSDMGRLLRAVDDVVRRSPRLDLDALTVWVPAVLAGGLPPPAVVAPVVQEVVATAPDRPVKPYPVRADPPAVKPLMLPVQRFHNATPFSAYHLVAVGFMFFVIVVVLALRPSTKKEAQSALPDLPRPAPKVVATPKAHAPGVRRRTETAAEENLDRNESANDILSVYRRPPGARGAGTGRSSSGKVHTERLRFHSPETPADVIAHYDIAFAEAGVVPARRRSERGAMAVAMERGSDEVVFVGVTVGWDGSRSVGQVSHTTVPVNATAPRRKAPATSAIDPARRQELREMGLDLGAEVKTAGWGKSGARINLRGSIDEGLAQAKAHWVELLDAHDGQVDTWTVGPEGRDRAYIASVSPHGVRMVILGRIDNNVTGFSLFADPLAAPQGGDQRKRDGQAHLLEAARRLKRGNVTGARVALGRSTIGISPYKSLLTGVVKEQMKGKRPGREYQQYWFWAKTQQADKALASELLEELSGGPASMDVAVALLRIELRCGAGSCRDEVGPLAKDITEARLPAFEKAVFRCARRCTE